MKLLVHILVGPFCFCISQDRQVLLNEVYFQIQERRHVAPLTNLIILYGMHMSAELLGGLITSGDCLSEWTSLEGEKKGGIKEADVLAEPGLLVLLLRFLPFFLLLGKPCLLQSRDGSVQAQSVGTKTRMHGRTQFTNLLPSNFRFSASYSLKAAPTFSSEASMVSCRVSA
jgi:hypothetical protein